MSVHIGTEFSKQKVTKVRNRKICVYGERYAHRTGLHDWCIGKKVSSRVRRFPRKGLEGFS